jgi:glycolate oxidase FAD binding subunit
MKQDLCKTVCSNPNVAVRGNGTKRPLQPHLDKPVESVSALDLGQLAGIVTYDPSEFLITALASTTIDELSSALAEHGQYLPFDPVLGSAGATLAGTIASGISGPNRMLYGSLRDFVMEVEVIDGLGRVVRGGGKVVKNAAGFDLPKLMVGSYGRLGMILEATLKVFPQPMAYVTMSFQVPDLAVAVRSVQKIQTNPLPLSAIEIESDQDQFRLVARFSGRPESLVFVVNRVQQLLKMDSRIETEPKTEAKYWSDLKELSFAPTNQWLTRVAISGAKVIPLDASLKSLAGVTQIRYSAGCSVAWVVLEPDQPIDGLGNCLRGLNLSGVLVRGANEVAKPYPFLGDTSWIAMAERIRLAMDPERKFSGYC